MKRLRGKQINQSGSALVYILIAIALLAALTVTFMEPSSQQTSSQSTFRTVSALQGQIDMIRSSIQECVLSFPKGDVEVTNAGSDPGARDNYPINPNSDYYVGSTDGPSGDRLVKHIRCPGNQPGPLPNDHEKIFSGSSGKFLPPPPSLFGNWQYYNGTDGVFFWIASDKTDAFIESALQKLNEKFSDCEADVVMTGSSGANLDSNGDTRCDANNMCFRVWMITNPSATFPDEPDC